MKTSKMQHVNFLFVFAVAFCLTLHNRYEDSLIIPILMCIFKQKNYGRK